MSDVLAVNVDDGYVETQPGIMNTELREYVARSGMWYAPDPASKDFCSIGGNVNTNAGGLCCVKYGVTQDAVLGLEVVMADGQVTRLGRRTIKGVAGYDLAGLMVVYEARLVAMVEESHRCVCGFPNQMEITHPLAASPRKLEVLVPERVWRFKSPAMNVGAV